MNPDKRNYLIIAFLGVLAWFPTLNFWFFKAYEATWLTGIAPYTVVNLIKGHGFLYFLDWKIFGWNPWGWYLTALIVQVIAYLLFYKFIYTISKKRQLAFISSLIFTVTTCYNDVLTWGSFNSYYPLLLICLLISLTAFFKYKEKNDKRMLVLSLLSAFLGFFVRETGIVLIPLIFAMDVIFTKNIFSQKEILGIVKRQIPFALIILGFFLIRSLYGGTPGDTADGNVKLQMRFMSDGLYFEYAKAAFLTIGKLIPPQIIPYDLMNYLREQGSKFVYYETMNKYFFPAVGWMTVGLFGLIWLKLKKSKAYFRIFLFFLIWLGLFSVFVSLAVPSTPEVLSRAYEYNTMRYRYFAFLGTSVLLGIILINYFTNLKLLKLFVAVVVVVNLILIWKIEREVYVDFYKPAKGFYTKFNSYFPKLSDNTTFYLYPHAPALGDYLLEWFTIKDKKYSNLEDEPFRVESQLIAVLSKVKNGKVNINDVVFLDHSLSNGLINETERTKKLLLNQKNYQISINKFDNVYKSSNFQGPVVDLPYNLDMDLSAFEVLSVIGRNPDSQKFRALANYSLQRNEYLKTVKVKTAYTMSQREGEPFFHVLPKNLIDGNPGKRSMWIADSFVPWIQVDLGMEKEISAVSWGSLEKSTRIPATYSVSVSRDNKNWKKVIDVKNSTVFEKIDSFDPVIARYVKMEIHTTSGGDFVAIDEFEVINSSSNDIVGLYSDRSRLFKDMVNMFDFMNGHQDLEYLHKIGLDTFWAKLTWETNKTGSVQNYQYLYFPFKFSLANQKINAEIPEGEIYSGSGDYLKKYFTNVSLDFGDGPFEILINSVTLKPRIKL